MYDATVTCVTRLRARPEKADELRELLGGLVAPSLHGRGCLQFQVLRHLGDRPEFLIVERWRSETQFRRNREAAHVAGALELAAGILEAPPQESVYRQVK